MSILELLKQHGLEAKKKSSGSGKERGPEYASACPACGGKDRFRCWPEQDNRGTWWCRGCNQGGDAITFLREFNGMSYYEACAALGVAATSAPRRVKVPAAKQIPEAFVPQTHETPLTAWQTHAGKLAAYAHAQLLKTPGQLAWLAARGIGLESVKAGKLGFLPGEINKRTGKRGNAYYRERDAWGLPPVYGDNGKLKKLWIPRGLVIPAYDAAGQVSRLRLRRMKEDMAESLPDLKFYVVSGSSDAPLFIPSPVPGPYAVVVVEAELDAHTVAHAARTAGLPVAALSVGNNWGKPDATAHAACQAALGILVALDFDTPDKHGKRPGAQGWPWWAETYRQAVRWPVDEGKDPGEYVELGHDLPTWLRAGLPPVLTQAETPAVPMPETPTEPASVITQTTPAPAGPEALPRPPSPFSSGLRQGGEIQKIDLRQLEGSYRPCPAGEAMPWRGPKPGYVNGKFVGVNNAR